MLRVTLFLFRQTDNRKCFDIDLVVVNWLQPPPTPPSPDAGLKVTNKQTDE